MRYPRAREQRARDQKRGSGGAVGRAADHTPECGDTIKRLRLQLPPIDQHRAGRQRGTRRRQRARHRGPIDG